MIILTDMIWALCIAWVLRIANVESEKVYVCGWSLCSFPNCYPQHTLSAPGPPKAKSLTTCPVGGARAPFPILCFSSKLDSLNQRTLILASIGSLQLRTKLGLVRKKDGDV